MNDELVAYEHLATARWQRTVAQREAADLAGVVSEIRWRLRATQYFWLADEILEEKCVAIDDPRWEPWKRG